MIKSCIIIVSDDQLPEQGYLEAVVKKYPTLSTMVTIKDGTIEVFDEPLKEYSAGDLQSYLTENPQGTKVVWMTNSEIEIPKEEIQPFVVLDADGTNYAYAYVTGEFPGFIEAGSTYSPAYAATERWLKDTMLKSANAQDYTDLDDGTQKIMKELKKPPNLLQFKTEFFGNKPGSTVIIGGGTYALLSNEEKTELKSTWGWASDNCGFGVVAEKPKFGQPRKTQTPAEPAKPSVPIVPAKPAEPAKPTDTPEPSGVWVVKHQSINGNTQAKEWIRNVLGFDQGSVIPDDLLTKVLSKEPIFVPRARWDVIRTKQIAKSIVGVKKPDLDKTKDTENKHIPSATGGSAIPVPVMSEDTKSQVAALFKQPGSINKTMLDNQSKEIMSRDDIKKILEKHDDWYTQLKDKVKLDIEKHMGYPYEAVLELARTNYQAVAVLAFTHACNRLMLMDRVKELEAKLKPTEVKEEKPALPEKKQFGQRSQSSEQRKSA